MPSASLPMYNLPGMRAPNADFWTVLRDLALEEGAQDLPETLDVGRAPVPADIGAEVVFTQTCGYPLQTVYAGQWRLLGRPCYAAPGCEGSTHCGFVVVREDAPYEALEDLRGASFALNSLHSNSGMNLPRRLIAPLARNGRFFGRVAMTGGHGPSLALVKAGGAHAACVDCLTWVFNQDYAPEAVAGLRVLASTPPSPAIPFVTSAATPDSTAAALARALVRLSDRRFEAVRAPLRIRRIEPAAPADYAGIMDYEAEAGALGYAELA